MWHGEPTRQRRRPKLSTAVKRWLTLAVACLGLIGLGWAVSSTRWFVGAATVPRFDEDPPTGDHYSHIPKTSRPPGADGNSVAVAFPPGLVDAFVAVMTVLLAGGLLAIVVLVVRHFLTTRPSGWDLVEDRAATQPDARELRDALRAGLTDIESGGDPRKAVIACWLRLERAAAAAGVERLDSETPSDLVARVLSAGHVDDAALRDLAEVYQRARYAPHDIDDAEREAARAALAAVDEQLAPVREPS